MKATSKLSITVKVGDAVFIGGARVCVVKKSGQLASLQIEADRDVSIWLEKASGPSSMPHGSTARGGR